MQLKIIRRLGREGVDLMLGAVAGFTFVELGLAGVLGKVGGPDFVALTMVAGFLIGRLAKRRILVAVDGLLLTMYFLLAITPFAALVSDRWIRTDPLPTQIDAVVVLSSGIQSNGALDVRGLDRIMTGIDLLNRKLTSRIVTTRIEQRYGRKRVTSDEEQYRFIATLRPAPLWDVVQTVNSTRDEATGTAKLLLPQRIRNIVVVTSPMHTRRACAAFESLGFVVACIPAAEHGVVTTTPQTAHDRLATFREYVYELLGTAKYRSKGWMR